MADQQFCLRWNNHQSTLVSVFDTLLENGVLVDCTLAAEGQSLKAHKVMLSACSPYLEHLLSQHYEKHPIIILKDVKFAELKSMIDYMYRGEVNISQEELGTFLKAAESLQIKGLTDNNEGDARDVGSTSKAPPPPRKSTLPASSTQLAEPQRPDATPASPGHRSRDGSISPTLRKRRRIRRHSQDDMGDNVLENSNSCDLPAQSTPIVPNIPLTSTTAPPMKATIVKPEQTELVNRIDTNLNSLPPESGLLKEKLEPEPLLLEPKTEYLDDNNDSVEDLTLDDDDDMDGMDVSQMSNLSNMSRPGPSHGNGSDISNQGFAPWHNQSGTDEVFMAAQEAVNNAHRDSQGALKIEELYWKYLNFNNAGEQKMMSFRCECGKTYPRYTSLWNHKRYRCGKQPQFSCDFCDHRTWHKCNLKSHMAAKHSDKMDPSDLIKPDPALKKMEMFKAKLNSFLPQNSMMQQNYMNMQQLASNNFPFLMPNVPTPQPNGSHGLPSNIPPLPPGLTISFQRPSQAEQSANVPSGPAAFSDSSSKTNKSTEEPLQDENPPPEIDSETLSSIL